MSTKIRSIHEQLRSIVLKVTDVMREVDDLPETKNYHVTAEFPKEKKKPDKPWYMTMNAISVGDPDRGNHTYHVFFCRGEERICFRVMGPGGVIEKDAKKIVDALNGRDSEA